MARRKRLYWQLFIPYLAIVLFAVVAILLYSSDLLEKILLKQTESDLRAQATLFQEQIRGNLPPDDQAGRTLQESREQGSYPLYGHPPERPGRRGLG